LQNPPKIFSTFFFSFFFLFFCFSFCCCRMARLLLMAAVLAAAGIMAPAPAAGANYLDTYTAELDAQVDAAVAEVLAAETAGARSYTVVDVAGGSVSPAHPARRSAGSGLGGAVFDLYVSSSAPADGGTGTAADPFGSIARATSKAAANAAADPTSRTTVHMSPGTHTLAPDGTMRWMYFTPHLAYVGAGSSLGTGSVVYFYFIF
jgi:type IV secretory pathway TrbL component